MCSSLYWVELFLCDVVVCKKEVKQALYNLHELLQAFVISV